MSTQKPKAQAPGGPEDDVEMGFFEHIGELRTRLMRAIYGLVPAVFLTWAYKEKLLDIIFEPLRKAWIARHFQGAPSVHFANPVDAFMANMQVALIAGLVLASPWMFWQLWAFVSPGLYRKEKLLALPFVLVSTIFFVGGVVFGYLIVFPMGLGELFAFAGTLPSGMTVTPTIMVDAYLDLATRMLLAFGVVFEVPVIVTFLALADIVTWRQLLQFSRWWLVVASILSAVLTPPDVASQMMMLIPLVVLYMISVGIAMLVQIPRARKAKAAD